MDEVRSGYYAVIPADVRYDDRIPANAKLLYGEISALIGAEGYCFASNQYFAKLYGMAEETIARLITKLEKAGHVHRELERDSSGQIISRKLFLRVSMPEIHPLDEKINTSPQKNQEGIDEKVKDTNPSITGIEKENKKEKSGRQKAAPMTDEQLRSLFIEWIDEACMDIWEREEKNDVYLALCGFYEPRANKKQEPVRTKAALTALTNRLSRYAKGCPSVMVDMLERATTAGWKSVFPLNGDKDAVPAKPSGGRYEEWL